MDSKIAKELAYEFGRYAKKDKNVSSSALDSYMRIQNMTPYVIEERPLNATSLDVFSRLMMDRIIFLGVPIVDDVANIVQAQLLFLESADASRDIQIYINSPGGSVYAGLGMYDTMQYIGPDVATICTGIAASMAAVLLCAGTAGKRSCLTHSRVMIHQPMSGTQGQVSDMEIAVKETLKVRDELYNIIANHSGKSFEQVKTDSDRDFWMSSSEALEYGMVDEVLSKK